MSIVAVDDHTGAIYNPEGFNQRNLAGYVRERGGVEGYPRAEAISKEDFWKIKADICVPAAVELQISPKIAENLQVRLIAEGANGPCQLGADEIFRKRGIDYFITDDPVRLQGILANGSG